MATPTRVPVSLEPGDHLTREEFHSRYCARPDIKKAELIHGVVYVPSPVSGDLHGEPHGAIVGWLYAYRIKNRAARLLDNATVLMDADGIRDEVQPDACLWRDVPDGPKLNRHHFLEGAPHFVVEIAASSAAYDLHEKKEAYRRNKVREYVVWRVLDGAIDWFELRDGAYVQREPDADGYIDSREFPGLRLHVPSMLADDVEGVLGALDVTGPP